MSSQFYSSLTDLLEPFRSVQAEGARRVIVFERLQSHIIVEYSRLRNATNNVCLCRTSAFKCYRIVLDRSLSVDQTSISDIFVMDRLTDSSPEVRRLMALVPNLRRRMVDNFDLTNSNRAKRRWRRTTRATKTRT